MEHEEHVELIKDGIAGRVWAELGSGRGAFTLALIELLGSACRIISIDRDPSALRKQQEQIAGSFSRKLRSPICMLILCARSICLL
jgi:ubiquinone/menaquinone biosynthesis C-methylase UbiE